MKYTHDNDQNPSEISLIHVAAQNHSAALQYLMENGADVKAEDRNGDTALEWAEYAECPMNIEVLKNNQKQSAQEKLDRLGLFGFFAGSDTP